MRNNPTAAHKRLWGRVFEAGCMACLQEGIFSFPEIHHWREYEYRNHSKVYGLCPIHHKEVSAVKGIPNRHLNPVEFREKYGTDEELFNQCMEKVMVIK